MSEVEIKNDLPEFVVTTENEILGNDTPENREIVRRIHACVNACQEITTEELENGIINDMRKVLSDVVPFLQENQVLDLSTEVEKPHFEKAVSELSVQKQNFFG